MVAWDAEDLLKSATAGLVHRAIRHNVELLHQLLHCRWSYLVIEVLIKEFRPPLRIELMSRSVSLCSCFALVVGLENIKSSLNLIFKLKKVTLVIV